MKNTNIEDQMSAQIDTKPVVGGDVMNPNSEPDIKECGTCWGGGKIDVDDDMRIVDCWTCGGSGKVKPD